MNYRVHVSDGLSSRLFRWLRRKLTRGARASDKGAYPVLKSLTNGSFQKTRPFLPVTGWREHV